MVQQFPQIIVISTYNGYIQPVKGALKLALCCYSSIWLTKIFEKELKIQQRYTQSI
jgi:hypothetical protein